MGFFRDGNGKKYARAGLGPVVSKKGGVRCAGGYRLPPAVFELWVGSIALLPRAGDACGTSREALGDGKDRAGGL